jgi:membrane protein
LSVEKVPFAEARPGASADVARRSIVVQILIDVWVAISADNISLLAAGVAFYTLLAIFPGLAFIVTLYGLLSDPAKVQREITTLQGVLPAEAWTAVQTQLLALTRQTTKSLSLASCISLALAFINARLGAYAMMGALNVVYKRNETRSLARTNLIAFLFTIGAIAVFVFNIYAVVAIPHILVRLGFPEFAANAVHTLRWPVLAALMGISLALIYRFGPDRKQGHWHWVTVGSLVATGLWLVGSAAFSWYVGAFNSYDKLYGSFGAVVILLYWFWLTSFAALMGAELDMQIQTRLQQRR